MKYILQISGLKQSNGSYRYKTLIHSVMGGYTGDKTFENEAEMIPVLNRVFASPEGERGIREVLNLIEGGLFQRSLELTDEQAESLGWFVANEKKPSK